jgi:hypothetical protein
VLPGASNNTQAETASYVNQAETASYVLCECQDSAGLRPRRLGKHFIEQSDRDRIALCKVLYFVGGTGLLAEWKCTIDQKMVAVQGSPCAPIRLILETFFSVPIIYI